MIRMRPNPVGASRITNLTPELNAIDMSFSTCSCFGLICPNGRLFFNS